MRQECALDFGTWPYRPSNVCMLATASDYRCFFRTNSRSNDANLPFISDAVLARLNTVSLPATTAYLVSHDLLK